MAGTINFLYVIKCGRGQTRDMINFQIKIMAVETLLKQINEMPQYGNVILFYFMNCNNIEQNLLRNEGNKTFIDPEGIQ